MATEEMLAPVQRADLLRFTTAGSVDDGKSTLIGRLLHDSRSLYEDHLSATMEASRKSGQEGIDLALLTDGLRAEREQRITIDVAYRHFHTPRRRFIIADTPGHEQYTRNMVTGASTADLAVVLVDASHGVLTQSRRHGFIAALLGIPHLVVAVNKMDQVDYDREAFMRIRETYAEYAASLGFRDVVFIPVSALRGDNVVSRSEKMPWYEGPSLLTHLETVPLADGCENAELRFPVQHVLRPDAAFRGYSGTLASGTVRVGDTVTVLPSRRSTRVSRILAPSGEVERAVTPQAITLCTEDDLDIGRGDMICHPEHLPSAAAELDATLIWMDEQPLVAHRPYILKHTTQRVRGQVVALHCRVDPNTLRREAAQTLQLNEIGEARLRLFRPLLCDPYTSNRQTGAFILIDPVTHFTVAAGLVREALGTEPKAAAANKPAAANITRHAGRVTAEQRAKLLRQRPLTFWLTGLSGAGKSTVAYALEERLIAAGHACMVLDGDNVRQGLNCDLGLSASDRSENIRRVAEVARLANDAGLFVIAALISPLREDRKRAREIIGAEQFVETFVDTPVSECERRDPKGLYARARAGQIREFTGISAPYEAPEAPDLRLDAAGQSVEALLDKMWEYLEAREALL